MEREFRLSLQLQIETHESWDICGTDEAKMRDDAINMIEEDDLCKFIQTQVKIFLGTLVTSKSSNDTLTKHHSDKVLWQNIDGIKRKHAAEIGRK